MPDFSHIDKDGKARMVDVSEKPITQRRAKAQARLKVNPLLFEKLDKNQLEKGDALATARFAGIQAAKRTSELIPLCHPLPISHVQIDIELKAPDCIEINVEVHTSAQTGVEMEALTAAAVSALTLYDMGKAVDRGMAIERIVLLEKEGGRSGHWKRDKTE